MSNWYEDDDRHERLVDTVAELGPVSSSMLAHELGGVQHDIHRALLRLEVMGSVVRHGRTRATTWDLG